MKLNKKIIFIVPRNDLEAVEIINLLRQSGEKVVVSQQRWGARWENLEPVVVAEVETLLAQEPEAEVVGVELAGSPRWNGRNIDHHRWSDSDRQHEMSSLEQVADLLGVTLSRYLRQVADISWFKNLHTRRMCVLPDESERTKVSESY